MTVSVLYMEQIYWSSQLSNPVIAINVDLAWNVLNCSFPLVDAEMLVFFDRCLSTCKRTQKIIHLF